MIVVVVGTDGVPEERSINGNLASLRACIGGGNLERRGFAVTVAGEDVPLVIYVDADGRQKALPPNASVNALRGAFVVTKVDNNGVAITLTATEVALSIARLTDPSKPH